LASLLSLSCAAGGSHENEATPIAPPPWSAFGAPTSVAESAAPAEAEPTSPGGSLVDLALTIADPRTRPERQWDHIVQASGDDCRAKLTESGAKFRAVPDVGKPNRNGCGIPRGVLLTRGPTGIQYSPPLSIDCSLALRLGDIERVIQEEAEEHLGAPVVRITTLGSYACRGVVGRLKGWSGGISEHSFGNAIDLATFQTKKGKIASVLRSYQPGTPEPSSVEGRFLRSVLRQVRKGAGLRVLGPDFDASHRDHFHVDAGSSPWD
jgi:hypothetical protein